MSTRYFDWDDPDRPEGNVQHIAEHDVTPEEVEDVLRDPRSIKTVSRSSGQPAEYGYTATGRYLLVVYEVYPGPGFEWVRPLTAYEVPPARGTDWEVTMIKRPKITYEEMNPEQRSFVDEMRAQRDTPEARARERAIREAVEAELPPAMPARARIEPPDGEFLRFVADLKSERERLGLSLADVSKSTGIDKATISKLENGRQPNPTLDTLRILLRALGLGYEIRIKKQAQRTPAG